MEAEKKFKHHLIRKQNPSRGIKLIQKFKFNDFVAAQTECDRLNEIAKEVNPEFYFIIITKEETK